MDPLVAAAALSGAVRDAPLKYVLTSPPRYHHWHHWSDEEAIDKNYVAHLPVIDWLFGTFYLPKDNQSWPRRYGTVGASLPKRIVRQFFCPFRRHRVAGPAGQQDA